MKRFGWFILVVIVLSQAFFACRPPVYSPRLVEIDSLCEDRADSAIMVLQRMAMDTAKMSPDDRMYYKFLAVKAADKAYIKHTSDSLIRQLLPFFEEGGDDRLLPEFYYYAGRVYRDIGDAPQALDYFQRAINLLPDTTNLKLKSVVYSQMGYTAYLCNLYDKALELHRGNYECGKLAKDTVSMIYGLMDMAVCQEMHHHLDSAEALYSDAMRLAQASHNYEMQASLHTQISVMLLSQGNKDEALIHIRKAIEYDDPDNRSATYSAAVDIFNSLGIEDSAFYYNTEALKYGTIYARKSAYGRFAAYYIKHGLPKLSLKYRRLYKLATDSVDNITATEAVARMNSLYNYQIRERENIQLKAEKFKNQNIIILLTFGLILTIVLIVVIIIYSRERRKALRYKLEKYERLINEYELRPFEEKQIEKETLNNTDIIQRIHRILNSPIKEERLTEEEWSLLSTTINSTFSGFDDKLFDLCKMSKQEYRVCLLIKANISQIDIATLIIKSDSTVSSIRRRLHQKAFGSVKNAREWDDFIHSL